MSNPDEDIAAALRAGDVEQAVTLAAAAVAAGYRSAQALTFAAYGLELAGRYDEALVWFEEARRLAPTYADILNRIGACHSKASRPLEALAAFEAAVAIRPDFAVAHHGMGLALAAFGDTDAALAAYTCAANLDPRYAEPLGSLAAIHAERGHWQEAEEFARRAFALDPRCSTAAVVLAQVEQRHGDLGMAEQRLRQVLSDPGLPPLHRASAIHALAETLEAGGRHAEAMDGYIAANAEFRRDPLAEMQKAGSEFGVEMCARLQRYFERVGDWKPASKPASGVAAGHVFLVGFPRSGTTLLEQVLASHPRVVALEEKDTLEDVFREYLQSDDGLDRLAGLSPEEEARLRSEYWQRVRAHGAEVAGKIFVDKQPLYILLLPAIAKLFPDARIVVARRDPRDVVVSCFRNRFRRNPLLIDFTDLERSALLYDGVMRLGELFEAKFGLPTHVLRHERLVEDFDGEVRALCAFLGIGFDERMREFVELAHGRDIRTPSAEQVRRGLNSEGVARWRRYGPAIEPILPILAPWVEKYGYPAA